MAAEVAGTSITVNAIAPGMIQTSMIRHLENGQARVPVGRLGTPDDVARAAIFLLAEDADYLTGEVLDVNGGFLID